MIIVGIAFMVPRLISETVIEPSGGASLASSSTVSCDEIFKNQLVRQQAAGNAGRMSQVKVQVQQRQNECAAEVWDPTILGRFEPFPGTTGTAHSWTAKSTTDGVPAIAPGTALLGALVSCHENLRTDDSDESRGSIGGLAVPRGIVRFTGGTTMANIGSGRDGENNIILFFSSNNDFRPSDGANCWMYVERFGSWVAGSQN